MDKCGAQAVDGPCELIRGHNMGKLDIPSNHKAKYQGDPTPATVRAAFEHLRKMLINQLPNIDAEDAWLAARLDAAEAIALDMCVCGRVKRGQCHWQPCDRVPTRTAKLPSVDRLHDNLPIVYCVSCDGLLDMI